ncbi:MAG: glycosyltransferase family 9 protein [Anaerolineae bacterium]
MRRWLRRIALRALAYSSAPFLPSERPSRISRILLIRPDHIGDLLFTTPALRLLRTECPQAHITCLVGPWGSELMERNANVDQVLVCPFPSFTRQPKPSFFQPYALLGRYARLLRGQKYDSALVLRFDHWWGALLAYWAGIPQRIGYALPELRPFLTQPVPYTPGRHEVEQNLTLIRAAWQRKGPPIEEVGPLEFNPSAEDGKFATRYLAERGIGAETPLIVIHPGAGAPVKLWRAEGFAQVGDRLAERYKARLLITGSSREEGLAREIASHMRSESIIATGQTTLGEMAALMAHANLVIGVDSGPLHLAVAQGVPTIHLYGPVDHRTFGPWGDLRRHRVVISDLDCIPCNRLDYLPEELEEHPCVRLITVEQVLEAACSLLDPSAQ